MSFINMYQGYLQCVTQTAFRVWGKSAEMCSSYQNGIMDTVYFAVMREQIEKRQPTA